MFKKISAFFIKNSKLTFVLVLVTLISGLGSYFVLPKQYNPTIIVPAFQIFINAPGLDSSENSRLILSPLENKIMELEGVDKVYGLSGDNYTSVMIKFKVGTDKEKAKIRLNQKLSENIYLSPIGIEKPIIKTIDPDELPQITFSISYRESEKNNLNKEDQYIYLRQIVNIIKDNLKSTKNVTTLDIVGGFVQNIIIELDLGKVEAKNISIFKIYEVLKNNNITLPSGNIINKNGEKTFIEVNGKLKDIEKIKKIVISTNANNIIYLGDVAKVKKGVYRIDKNSSYTNMLGEKVNAVFLGIGKAIGTNAVFVSENIISKVKKIKKTLPSNIKIDIIQDEGKTAKDATNMLIVNLVQSIIIVFIILSLYLGVKNAFNTALSIPLTLGMVFLLAYIFGENINKITLFALILVLGMLVDNSTVVVENISRHLKIRGKEGKTKLEAVLEGVQEVGTGIILSTISRLLAFGAMFAVTGMMGEYMGPIPKFAIRALLVSLLIAFTVNPWISYYSAKDINKKNNNKTITKGESPLKIRKKYINFMKKFINNNKKTIKLRKRFKVFFWLSLLIIIIAPIYIGIFKARMLPKSDQNQVYLWIDAPRGWTIKNTSKIEDEIINILIKNKKIKNSELGIVKSISMTSGQAFMGDFANLFRGGNGRVGENQISARINLFTSNDLKEELGIDRIKSEEYVIKMRPILRKYLLQKYPDLKISLLEDPPGPPVRATFLAKIKSNGNKEEKRYFINKIKREIEKVAKKESIVDLGDSISDTYRKISIDIDNESLSRAGLSVQQINYNLAIILNGLDISIVQNKNAYETSNIVLGVKKEDKNSISLLKNISFINNASKRISLTSVAKINYNFVSPKIYTDSKEETSYIYGEMGSNSLIYPVIKLYSILKSTKFLGDDYRLKSWSPYNIAYIGLKDGKEYILEWGGEWELTMDTFKDLGIAMLISLLAIYFLLVGQFSSFRIAGIIMITFLLSFFGVFPGFTLLYILQNEYFSATSMIGIIALGGIVVGNAIMLIDYVNILKKNGLTIEDALLKAGYVRFAPIILTSLTTIFGAATIIGDPVWSGLAWTIIWGLLLSSILTLIVIPIFYYDSQKEEWSK